MKVRTTLLASSGLALVFLVEEYRFRSASAAAGFMRPGGAAGIERQPSPTSPGEGDPRVLELREELNALRLRAATFDAPPAAGPTRFSSVASETSAFAGPLLDISRLSDAGNADPASAFQTIFWAITADRLADLERVIGLSPSGREGLEKYWRGLTGEQARMFPTPMSILAYALRQQVVGGAVGFRIVDQIAVDPTHVIVAAERVGRDGGKPSPARLPMELGPSGWRIQFPDSVIADLPEAIRRSSQVINGNSAPP